MSTFIDAPPRPIPAPIPLLRQRSAATRLDRAAQRGEVLRVSPGVYVEAGAYARLTAWDRYLTRVHAAAATRPDAVFGWESAAALLGLPVFGHPREVHILSTAIGTSRTAQGVREHATADHRTVVRVGGIAVTSIADTVVDLCRARHNAIGVAVADAALRRELGLDRGTLAAINEARLSSRGRRSARWAIDRADARAETVLESVSRCTIEWLGFPLPELQVEVRQGSRTRRLDVFWPEERVGGEADGLVKYDGSIGDPRQTLIDEKAREDGLRRVLNGFARWGWQDLHEPERLAQILRDAGLRQIRPVESLPLATLGPALSGAA